MSTLRGLIDVVGQDPKLSEIVSRARATGALATQGLEISAPNAIAPFIAAAIAKGRDSHGRAHFCLGQCGLCAN